MAEKINVNGVVDTLGDALKLATNLTSSNLPHVSDESVTTVNKPNQTVQIQVKGDNEPKEHKPVIIREKKETHIHKDFPETRTLSDKECELAMEKIRLENALKVQEMEYQKQREEQERRDRTAREAQARQDRIVSEAKQEKRNKIRAIITAVMVAIGGVGVGYKIYTDNKNKTNNIVVNGVVE